MGVLARPTQARFSPSEPGAKRGEGGKVGRRDVDNNNPMARVWARSVSPVTSNSHVTAVFLLCDLCSLSRSHSPSGVRPPFKPPRLPPPSKPPRLPPPSTMFAAFGVTIRPSCGESQDPFIVRQASGSVHRATSLKITPSPLVPGWIPVVPTNKPPTLF